MAKKINRIDKLQFIGCQAKPCAELASLGINMPKFCTTFNNMTKNREGEVVPVVVTSYVDKSFDLVLKTTPTSILLLKKLNIKKGSGNPKKELIGSIDLDDVKEIANYKLPDLNTNDLDVAISIIASCAKSLGITINNYSNIKKDNYFFKFFNK